MKVDTLVLIRYNEGGQKSSLFFYLYRDTNYIAGMKKVPLKRVKP